jgi:hypothetical protein
MSLSSSINNKQNFHSSSSYSLNMPFSVTDILHNNNNNNKYYQHDDRSSKNSSSSTSTSPTLVKYNQYTNNNVDRLTFQQPNLPTLNYNGTTYSFNPVPVGAYHNNGLDHTFQYNTQTNSSYYQNQYGSSLHPRDSSSSSSSSSSSLNGPVNNQHYQSNTNWYNNCNNDDLNTTNQISSMSICVFFFSSSK